MPAIGVDISDEKVKYIQLVRGKHSLEVEKWGMVCLAEGAMVQGKVQKAEPLVEALGSVRKLFSSPFVHASLPEDHAYLFQTDVGQDVPDANIRTLIEFQLKENVPLSPDEALFDFAYVPDNDNNPKTRRVSVAVYPKDIVYSYLSLFHDAGFVPLSLEIEGQANARAVVPEGEKETVMVVDVGKYGAELSIVVSGVVAYTATLEVSGDDFTQALVNRLTLSYAAAEKLKIEQGFVKSRENETQFEVLLGLVSALRDEINKHIAYWKIHTEKDSTRDGEVAQVLLCGGSANLKGLLPYLNATMETPVAIANVWSNVASFEEHIPQISRADSVAYATAIGLSLRAIARSA